MQNKTKHPIMISVIGVLVALGCLGGFWQYAKTHYVFQTNAATQTIQRLKQTKPQTATLVFYKKGCAHCQQAEPIVAQALQQTKLKTYLVSVTNPTAQSLIQQYQVTQTPTFIKLKGGQVVSRYTGVDKQQIQAFFPKAN